MERSSSQTRMLATPTSSRCFDHLHVKIGAAHAARRLCQMDTKFCARAGFRVHGDLRVVRLKDLIDDSQSKSRAHAEARLEWLKYLLQSSLLDALPRI